ncbi:MAG: oxidoreductase-like domain-containing protein [Gammaproteobacteria bacterium]
MSRPQKKSLEHPPKPTPPEPYECCEQGCDPCVHDTYAKALPRWEKRVSEIEKIKKKKLQRKMLK